MKNESEHTSKENIKKILEQIPNKDIEKTILQIPKEVLDQISEKDIKKAAHQIPKEDIEKVISDIPQKDIKKISKIEEVTPDDLEQLSAGIGPQIKKSLKYLGAAAILIAAAGTSYAVGNFRGKKHGKAVGYESGFNEGHAKGYGEGHAIGLEEGHKKGYGEGHAIGLEEGHKKGYTEGFSDLLNSPVKGVKAVSMYMYTMGMATVMEALNKSSENTVETITLP